MELAVARLRHRGLSTAERARMLRHIEGFLRFYNRPENAPALATRTAETAVSDYLRWLALQPAQDARDLETARRAIELLYSDVFGLPLVTPP